MLLNELIKNAPAIEISQLSHDSRVPMKDCIFFCIKGVKYNGHEYIDEAIENGAKVIVYSDDIDTKKNAIFVKVQDVNEVLAKISNKFYGNPASKMDVFLTGGAYGRSTTNKIIFDLLNNKKQTGYIGIRGIRFNDKVLMSYVPTLTVLENQKYLKEFVKNGIEVVTLEANFQAFEFRKVNFFKPKAFIYTISSDAKVDFDKNNLSTVQRYLYTLDENTTVILNRDDICYDYLYPSSPNNLITYGRSEESDILIRNIELTSKNTTFTLDIKNKQYNVLSPMLGMANVYNLTAAISALLIEGMDIEEILELVKNLRCPSGIYERLDYEDYNIIVDCCTTLESYQAVLDFAKKVTGPNNKVVSVISINSTDNNQRLKNLMNIVKNSGSRIILTEDDSFELDINENLINARNIIPDTNCLLIEERESAIECAIELINKNDTLLLLGKGSEKIIYKGYTKAKYLGDRELAKKYMDKRLKEEAEIDY